MSPHKKRSKGFLADRASNGKDHRDRDGCLGQQRPNRRTPFRVPLAKPRKDAMIRAKGRVNAGAGKDQAVDRPQGRYHDQKTHRLGAPIGGLSTPMAERQSQYVGGYGMRRPDSVKAQSKQIGSVDKKVNQNDSAGAQNEGQGDSAAT